MDVARSSGVAPERRSLGIRSCGLRTTVGLDAVHSSCYTDEPRLSDDRSVVEPRNPGPRNRGRLTPIELRRRIGWSLSLAGVACVLVLLAGRWSDLTTGQGVVIGGLGVLVSALVVASGIHRTRLSTDRAATAALRQAEDVAETEKANADRILGELKLAREQAHHRETERDLRARFTLAASQLADPSGPVRLAGIFAMASLADDWHALTLPNHDERQVCIDVLRAYLRTPMGRASAATADPNPELEIRQTIVRVVRGRVLEDEGTGRSWKGANVDLSRSWLAGASLIGVDLGDAGLACARLFGADLTDADLVGANLAAANLAGASLIRAGMSDADLATAILSDANLYHADLHRANMYRANLTCAELIRVNLARTDLHDANLTRANLYRADLTDATLTCADLTGANLAGANLAEANLTRADLTGADLTGANLTGANLTGATISGADTGENPDPADASVASRFLSATRFTDAVYDARTKWPDDFRPPPSRDTY